MATTKTPKKTPKPAAAKARPVSPDPIPPAPAAEPQPAATPKKLSALDACAQVLAEAKEPMSAPALIEAMAARKLWASPNGKTPASTLYSALLREIAGKGAQSRFRKVDKGRFTIATV